VSRNVTRPHVMEAAWKQGLRLYRLASVAPDLAELQAPDLGQTWDERASAWTAPQEAPAVEDRSRGWARRR
jgi:hypothetical protein